MIQNTGMTVALSLIHIYEMYRRSIEDPEAFWAQMAAEHLDWFKLWDAVEEYDFTGERPYARYFRGGRLNASYNCLDRHLNGARRNKAALIWQGEPSEEVEVYTYQRLHREVCKAANMLKRLGVRRGDRVVLYLPMIPQLAIGMLACARIGAIHCVVFSGLSAEALKDRIDDSGATVVVTSNYGYRAGKILDLKGICDQALALCPQVKKCIVVRRIDKRTDMTVGRDLWWEDRMAAETSVCEPESMEATDPLFILYTSGSTAKPKGIVHGNGGYLLYAAVTSKYVFDLKESDVFWCTADVGWITGHSYLVYGALANGATSLMFEGVPTYPQPDRYWEVVEKFGVNVLYTAPTAIRSMMKEGEQWVNGHDIGSLRMLGSVGEPITSKAWLWYYSAIGQGRCPVADTCLLYTSHCSLDVAHSVASSDAAFNLPSSGERLLRSQDAGGDSIHVIESRSSRKRDAKGAGRTPHPRHREQALLQAGRPDHSPNNDFRRKRSARRRTASWALHERSPRRGNRGDGRFAAGR